MTRWNVMYFVDSDGSVPFRDEWLQKSVTNADKAKVHARFRNIESIDDDLPPQWWERYRSTNGLYELRVTGPGKKMLRPLGIRTDTRELLFFFGSVEKGNRLNRSDLTRADALKSKWENGPQQKIRWS